MHPNNIHKDRYDFDRLVKVVPALQERLIDSHTGDKSIDFSSPKSVLLLNQALLQAFYNVEFWQLPDGYLCPAIPGRADYIHHLADLLAETNETIILKGGKVKVLDIGSGANCVYPIIGSQSYGWSFVGTDIDPVSVKMASLIVSSNINLNNKIKVKLQKNSALIFDGIIGKKDHFSLTMCNPPFHASMQKMQEGNDRKVKNLSKNKMNADQNKTVKSKLNFGGTEKELCYPGGEIAFLKQMCKESVNYATQVGWFTTLVSKSENIAPLKKLLTQLKASDIKVIKMAQGQKISRILAWQF